MTPANNPLPETQALRGALCAENPPAADTIVVGSGPGGAAAAATLAEAGREVLMLESGGEKTLESHPPFGAEEMAAKYRAGGMTAVIARPAVNYVEGECLGGGSEINSGLYHRPPPETLNRWADQWKVRGFGETALDDICAENERDIGVCKAPGPAQPASRMLENGAQTLGWSCPEIPKWFRHAPNYDPRAPKGERMGMTRTLLPRFARAGGRILAGCEALKLEPAGSEWSVAARRSGQRIRIRARNIFVCAGAIRTPALLRRSGFGGQIGNALALHVYARAIAEFKEEVNAPGAGVGPHQVDEFAPQIHIGCGVGTAAHMAAALAQAGADDWLDDHREKWRRRAAYYVGAASDSGGVRPLPFCARGEAALARLSPEVFYHLADGLRRLCRILFAAGATRVLPILEGAAALRSPDDLWKLPRPLPPHRSRLSTVHVMGTCPMGEISAAAADSFGRVDGRSNLRIADASLFCDSPGVNPQGGVLALSRRVARNFLEEQK